MHHLFRLIFLFLILTSQGCQTLNDSLKTFVSSDDPDQIHSLLSNGKQFSSLNKEQKLTTCQQLKQEYKTQPDWQTAWLLVYSLNDNFKCVSLKRSLELLNSIQTSENTNKQLKWLNKKQIKILSNFNSIKKKSKKLHKQNQYIKTKLDKAKEQLEELNAKIQELKAIETSINKKTQ